MRKRLTWKKKATINTEQFIEKQAGSGMYGSTKAIESSVLASVRKIQKRADKIAKVLYKKNAKTAQFLATHSKRSKSSSAKVIMDAMANLGPKFAADKTAGHGMYGYDSKVAALCLAGCTELKQYVGEVVSDLHRRKAAKHANVMSFLKSHKKEAKCACSSMMLSYYPDASTKFASNTPKTVSDWIKWEDWK